MTQVEKFTVSEPVDPKAGIKHICFKWQSGKLPATKPSMIRAEGE